MDTAQIQLHSLVITVSKRGLRRLCFQRCLFVCLSTGWGCPGKGPGGCPGPGLGVVVSTPRPEGQGVFQHALRQTPPPPADGYCCGRYASYWNAFLLLGYFYIFHRYVTNVFFTLIAVTGRYFGLISTSIELRSVKIL